MTLSVDHDEMVALCKRYGPLLRTPDGVDGAQLLWAIAGNESEFGARCTPRHEPGYCPITKGKYAFSVSTLTESWGCLAHCSLGWSQIMFPNCTGYGALELMTDPEVCAQATIMFLNRQVFGLQRAMDLKEIGECYNGGHIGASVPEYVTKLINHYAVALE